MSDNRMDLEPVNTHQLREGDVVVYYNATFRIHNRHVYYNAPSDTLYDPLGVVTFETDLLEFRFGPLPKGWAEEGTIQGNSMTMWLRMKSE